MPVSNDILPTRIITTHKKAMAVVRIALHFFLLLTLLQTTSRAASPSTANHNRREPVFGAACRDHSDCTNSVAATTGDADTHGVKMGGISPPVCDGGTCQCPAYHLRVNGTHCLAGRLLGFQCSSDSQCRVRVPMAGCVQGVCQCGDGFTPYRRSNCLPASPVGGGCRSQGQCRSWSPHAYCNYTVPRVYGHCTCTPEYTSSGDGHCHPRNLGLGSACSTSRQCSLRVRSSICVQPFSAHDALLRHSHAGGFMSHNRITESQDHQHPSGGSGGVCACPKGYLAEKEKCTPIGKEIGEVAVSLGQRCARSTQCRASDPNSECNSAGMCDCARPSLKCSASSTGCHPDTFQCVSDGACISSHYVCDGTPHCHDHSDEAECEGRRCSPHSFRCPNGRCVSRGVLCDGKKDCQDGADEDNCTGDCPKSTFRCGDGRCLPGYVFCNAKSSCSDGSDEDYRACILGAPRLRYCPFRCNNGRCRSVSVLCSGRDGCGDNSDEERCAVCACPAV